MSFLKRYWVLFTLVGIDRSNTLMTHQVVCGHTQNSDTQLCLRFISDRNTVRGPKQRIKNSATKKDFPVLIWHDSGFVKMTSFSYSLTALWTK